jgi:hypothetical protein
VDTDLDAVTPDAVTLWRPTGPEELALVAASGWRAWPPRLAEQVHQVGGRTTLEYWIPAPDLAELNATILGPIELVAEYHQGAGP